MLILCFGLLVMSDGILQGDPVSCERCGGNGNYLSAFGLQDCCAFFIFLFYFIEVLKDLYFALRVWGTFLILAVRVWQATCLREGRVKPKLMNITLLL